MINFIKLCNWNYNNRGKNGLGDYINYIGKDDINMNRGENGIIHYPFLDGQNCNLRLYFCCYKNSYNLTYG